MGSDYYEPLLIRLMIRLVRRHKVFIAFSFGTIGLALLIIPSAIYYQIFPVRPEVIKLAGSLAVLFAFGLFAWSYLRQEEYIAHMGPSPEQDTDRLNYQLMELRDELRHMRADIGGGDVLKTLERRLKEISRDSLGLTETQKEDLVTSLKGDIRSTLSDEFLRTIDEKYSSAIQKSTWTGGPWACPGFPVVIVGSSKHMKNGRSVLE